MGAAGKNSRSDHGWKMRWKGVTQHKTITGIINISIKTMKELGSDIDTALEQVGQEVKIKYYD